MARHCSKCGLAGHYSSTCGTKTVIQTATEEVPTEKVNAVPVESTSDDGTTTFSKPRKGLWLANQTSKKVAGKIMYVKSDGTVVYESPLGASVESSPETIVDAGYTYVELTARMLNWYHG
jgi:hypothetical protein